jgi:CheY-like chemotaxis protein
MRSAHSGGSLHLVALTGYGQASDKARAREAGFDAHLVKPVDLQRLQRLLEGFRNGSPPSEGH